MKKQFYALLLFFVMTTLVIGYVSPASAQAPKAEPIKLSLISYTAVTDAHFMHWKPLFIDEINAQAKGALIIEVRGGPEVMSISDMAKATAAGVVDMAIASTANFADFVPGSDLIKLSEITWQEEIARGLPAYLDEIYAKAGLKFLSRKMPININYFRICLKKKIMTKEGFKGIRLGAPPPVHGALAELGAAPVRAVIPEYYTAIERGLVFGSIFGGGVYVENALHEVAPFVVDNPYFRPTAMVFMNLKKWESLPRDMKELILRVRDDMQRKYEPIYMEWEKGAKARAIARGAEYYTLPPEVASWYLKSIYDGTWKTDAPKNPPAVVERIRTLISR